MDTFGQSVPLLSPSHDLGPGMLSARSFIFDCFPEFSLSSLATLDLLVSLKGIGIKYSDQAFSTTPKVHTLAAFRAASETRSAS